MKWLKEDSPTAKKFQELEEYLKKNKITISAENDYLQLEVDGKTHILEDIHSDYPGTLPRVFDTERFGLNE
jgi:hypothetical protein